MTTPITRFEKWNYQAQCQIFTKLYIHTAKTEWIRGPVFIAFGTSLAVRAVLLTASVGDLIINGFRLTLNPYQSSEQRQRGWTLLKKVPSQVGWNLIGVSLITFMISTFLISFDPEFYILVSTEEAKINWIHAEKGTLNIEEHDYDFRNVTSEGKTGREKWKNSQGIALGF
ncbi:hypothetical protein [Candidatus Rhabdochlamydia sp. T3358]|uniref:hypothetical protein n=1 Tax=Candidatus Rhabdochlamydia sp. T3358 TaxID=2099795 RepID=UPI0010B19303|nr:hypothetical protein [Candidatus Rhabdochlamydia sp. T3358]VHN99708.1 hypothetical protein RHT_00116 [Candidatus Rhabdochlamydia sp. T3358]